MFSAGRHFHSIVPSCLVSGYAAPVGLMREAGPAEVLGATAVQVARREFQRLRRSNEMHPGHAMARAYLETLADLPWNKFAAPGSQGHGPSSSSVPGPDTGAATDLSLADARSLLDKEHFGLDRVRHTWFCLMLLLGGGADIT